MCFVPCCRKKIGGSGLKDVNQRHNEEWIVNFVRHSQQVINSGVKSAVALYEEYNKTLMPDHLDVTATDIKNILSYIKEESVKVANAPTRSEEHTSELQSRGNLVCRLL